MTQSNSGWAYLDGSFVPAAEARVAADDAALLYGRGLFETFRARRGAVYRLDRHLQRLKEGARTLGIEATLSSFLQEGELEAAVRDLAARCGLDDARMRLTLTAGPLTELRTGPAAGRPALIIQCRAATDYPAELYQRGVSAVPASVRRNESSPLCRIKSLNYLDNLLAREEAGRAGADEALLLNSRGLLAEGSASNLFLVRDGPSTGSGQALLTPRLEDGALPGVTRGAVLELARAAGIEAHEASLTLEDLLGADEAFLTNAVGGVLPLVSVDGGKVGTGRPGAVTGRLRTLYESAVAATG